MTADNRMTATDLAGRLVVAVSGLSWLRRLAQAWRLVRGAWPGIGEAGLYEVLEYESALELLDTRGERAVFRKRERVRYLQNAIIAYQDQAWGDGAILLRYRCTPGLAADRYRLGPKTYVLISLREVKRRGDIDEFHIQWGIRRGFLRSRELWETEVSHRTRRLKVQVVFPKARPPLRLWLVEYTCRRKQWLEPEAMHVLPDGRWLVSWETERPRLHERYLLHWEW